MTADADFDNSILAFLNYEESILQTVREALIQIGYKVDDQETSDAE